MSLQHTGQPRSSANGFGHLKNDRDSEFKAENRLQTGKTSGKSSSVGKEGGSLSRERLVYLTTCLIGHNVEVQVLDGSVYSGIFHAIHAEDFGIILKMARLITDGSGGAKSNSDLFNKPPSKILIIPSEELVQVIAKGVPVTRDGLTPGLQAANKQELMTDSSISQSRHVEMQRELERWVPADDVPECPELENIFDGSWNRGWDQFEVNKTLFGVKSTFNEELYTTKLEKGPRMRELENEALRIAREIEGEDTSDFHLAEERGIQLHANLEADEETKYSSVFRRPDDSGYDDDTEEILLDYCNDETFGGRTFYMEGFPMSQLSTSGDLYQSGSGDSVCQLSMDHLPKNIRSKPDDACSSLMLKEEDSGKARLSADATSFTLKSRDKESSSSGQPEIKVFSKTEERAQSSNSGAGPSSSASSNSNIGIAASTFRGPGLSPSSLSAEKSALNPHAKEFRLNPNAKSFSPSQTPSPVSPVSDGPLHYPANLATVPHMNGMTGGVGPGHAYPAHQPVIFHPQAAPTTQAYFPPGGPQMMFGHPRQLVYMPPYPTETQYKGREY